MEGLMSVSGCPKWDLVDGAGGKQSGMGTPDRGSLTRRAVDGARFGGPGDALGRERGRAGE